MMVSPAYRICSRCLMDTSDPQIVFNEAGQCDHCCRYLAHGRLLAGNSPGDDERLNRALDKIRLSGKGKAYDCVAGVSGGVDSSYLLYLAKKWQLRVLAVHMDNGWDSDEAVKNVLRLCDYCGFDYQSYVLDWPEFRAVQLAFLRASIVEMELPTDVAIMGTLHKVAKENGVRYILSGGNLFTEGILPYSWFYDPKDSVLLNGVCRKFGAGRPRKMPRFDLFAEAYYKFLCRIKILYPLNYVPFDKAEVKKLLIDECGWIDYGGKHHESRFTKIVQAFIQPVKFGVDYRRATLSVQICNGEITRPEALEELSRLPYDPATIDSEKAFVAKKLGISPAEFESILALPVRNYKDYPNNEWLLSRLYKLYRKLFGGKESYPTGGYLETT